MAQWLERGRRKPLVLRGASQVGKTWPVRELARRAGLELVELNFEEQLVSFLSTATTEQPSVPVHDKLMRLYREYTVVGGMPDAVMEWLDTHSAVAVAVADVHQNLIRTYREDFNKYPSRLEFGAIEKVMAAVPQLLGQKFKYSNVDRESRVEPLRRSLELLTTARVCHTIRHTSGNGIPLAAEESQRIFKTILLGVVLVSSMQGIVLENDAEIARLIRAKAGGIAE